MDTDLATLRERTATRFWSKVVIGGEDECWQWLAATRRGYGLFGISWRPTRQALAHRFAYEFLVGPIPEGMTLDHLCRNRGCVNPAHLEPVTGRENTLRGNGPAGVNARKTYCERGHAYDDENTYWVKTPTGRGRKCRICERARRRVRTLAARKDQT
jgi:hypothetical protein